MESIGWDNSQSRRVLPLKSTHNSTTHLAWMQYLSDIRISVGRIVRLLMGLTEYCLGKMQNSMGHEVCDHSIKHFGLGFENPIQEASEIVSLGASGHCVWVIGVIYIVWKWIGNICIVCMWAVILDFDWSKGSEGMVLGGDNSTYFDSKRPTSPWLLSLQFSFYFWSFPATLIRIRKRLSARLPW